MAKKKTTRQKTTKKRTTRKKAPAKKAPSRKTAKAKSASRTGLLDAAAQVLAGSKDGMTCAEIVEAILAKKLWSTKGKTPAATLSSGLHREIAFKGKDSRFEKVGRGLFRLRKGA